MRLDDKLAHVSSVDLVHTCGNRYISIDLLKDSIKAGDLYAGLSLQRLQVFVAVADHGGFSAAADYLDLGQPTVSFHIKALERLLGAKLLVYRGRRVHLTPEGTELYRVASAMLRDAERMAASIRNLGEGQSGQLRVGASMAFELSAFFEHVIAPFRRTHPGVQLTLQFGHSVRLAEAVHDDRLDLAYVINWRLPTGARYEPLHHGDFVLMVAADHGLARKRHVTSEDVYAAGLITAPIYSQEWPHYEQLLRASGLDHYRVGLEIDGVQARLLATQAGLGVMGVFVPPFAADGVAPRLRSLRLAGKAAPRVEFGLVAQPEPTRTPVAREFIVSLRSVTRHELAVADATQ
jgi:DNA-binding transcriptional LysR family regulator